MKHHHIDTMASLTQPDTLTASGRMAPLSSINEHMMKVTAEQHLLKSLANERVSNALSPIKKIQLRDPNDPTFQEAIFGEGLSEVRETSFFFCVAGKGRGGREGVMCRGKVGRWRTQLAGRHVCLVMRACAPRTRDITSLCPRESRATPSSPGAVCASKNYAERKQGFTENEMRGSHARAQKFFVYSLSLLRSAPLARE